MATPVTPSPPPRAEASCALFPAPVGLALLTTAFLAALRPSRSTRRDIAFTLRATMPAQPVARDRLPMRPFWGAAARAAVVSGRVVQPCHGEGGSGPAEQTSAAAGDRHL